MTLTIDIFKIRKICLATRENKVMKTMKTLNMKKKSKLLINPIFRAPLWTIF